MSTLGNRTHLHTTYERWSNGIHHFVFQKATRQAVDDGFYFLHRVIEVAPPGRPLMFFNDLRPEGPPPMPYLFRRFREFYTTHRFAPGTRIAYVMADTTLFVAATGFFAHVNPTASQRFFDGEVDDEVIAWLLGKTKSD